MRALADRLTDEELAARLGEILARAGDLRSLVAQARGRGAQPAHKVVVRVWGEAADLRATLTRFEGKRQVSQETIPAGQLAGRAGEIARSFDTWEVSATSGALHARRAKKAILATRGRPEPAEALAVPAKHDRAKDHLLDPADPETLRLLRAIGLASVSGHVLAGRERKLRQVERFVRLVRETLAERAPGEGELRILDAGCGAAYLTFALRHVLARERRGRVTVLGVDVRADVIEQARAVARELGVEGDVAFEQAQIKDARLDRAPDVVLSLHACDTATDEALARGVALGARAILAAPCCQHELHKRLADPALAPLVRHGILRERLADLATDALRATILRGAGYRTDVVEFVDQEATSKNLLIRATRLPAGADREPASRWSAEVAALKGSLGLEGTVALERLLAEGAPGPSPSTRPASPG